MNIENYWEFFSKNTFAQGDELQFFADGTIAIRTGEKNVSHHSEKAKLIARFENAVALNNGIICVEDRSKNEVSAFKNGEKIYTIPLLPEQKVFPLVNAFMLFARDEHCENNALYVIPFSSAPYVRFPLKESERVEKTSVDGKALICTGGTQNRLLDANFKEVALPAFYRIDFLPYGAYIVYFRDMASGCALYNRENERVLYSTQDHGIRELGEVVAYEDKLIVSSNGAICGEYNGEKTVIGGQHIYPYKIGKNAYWLGGVMKYASTFFDNLLYYQHDGVFYIYPVGKEKSVETLVSAAFPQFSLYKQRILEMSRL